MIAGTVQQPAVRTENVLARLDSAAKAFGVGGVSPAEAGRLTHFQRVVNGSRGGVFFCPAQTSPVSGMTPGFAMHLAGLRRADVAMM